ncbi:uncharacterized protein MONBRDRAFT_34211 [Monosiga brevicollis MX1]|uniref:Uncharacterized protein n=1 Tax=Monosiga brevicollis TaxID=81824 RepID=A9VA89_MONBE|nr:uncharacterized protein MONBRDRAFT_34211 [Monosiga brevicollis MX1]EDQ85444.1 predicted protein [Monosiga brevicollis MX1]|eukprot:XP_001749635.1 hypothetical protein [Monosiga brevicollis MX1]
MFATTYIRMKGVFLVFFFDNSRCYRYKQSLSSAVDSATIQLAPHTHNATCLSLSLFLSLSFSLSLCSHFSSASCRRLFLSLFLTLSFSLCALSGLCPSSSSSSSSSLSLSFSVWLAPWAGVNSGMSHSPILAFHHNMAGYGLHHPGFWFDGTFTSAIPDLTALAGRIEAAVDIGANLLRKSEDDKRRAMKMLLLVHLTPCLSEDMQTRLAEHIASGERLDPQSVAEALAGFESKSISSRWTDMHGQMPEQIHNATQLTDAIRAIRGQFTEERLCDFSVLTILDTTMRFKPSFFSRTLQNHSAYPTNTVDELLQLAKLITPIPSLPERTRPRSPSLRRSPSPLSGSPLRRALSPNPPIMSSSPTQKLTPIRLGFHAA